MSSVLLSVKDLCYLNNGPYSLDVYENSILGLTGASGIGKTQLLRAIVESIVFTGELFFKNVSSSEFSAPMWRKKIGLVPAESAWWHTTVGEHFVAEQKGVSLSELLADLEFSEDILHWKVSRLSTGEKQRLALVRELLLDPSILLLDEPCSNLDQKSVSLVESLIETFTRRPQKGTVWVSHDLQQLRRVATCCYEVLGDGLELV